MSNIECYSRRLLNPFRGVLNIIAYESAEAVTTDGVHWDIYVRNDELVKDLECSYKVQTSDIRYGSWSEEQGLKRGPLAPSDEFKRLEGMGAVVYEQLLLKHNDVPFPYIDNYELWLLDKEMQPLALLDSAISVQDMDCDHVTDWRAGIACRECFQSSVIPALVCDENKNANAADYLTQYINNCAGDNPCTQWFKRQSNGDGIAMQGNDPFPEYNRILKLDYPKFFLKTKGHDQLHTKLVDEFIKWQAPWLLLLDGLDKPTRTELEQFARQQALAVEKQFRLYPQIVDQAAIKAARVEAMMRKGQQQEVNEEEVMSTFYIEMHPCPSE